MLARKTLFLLSPLALLAAASTAHAVAGGESVDIASVPFVASTTACTGTLIAPDRLLTAAHCVDGVDPARSFVIVGADAHDVVAVPKANRYAMKGWSQAPGYKLSFPFAHKRPQNATAVNDVAVIVLAKPIAGIQPVAVAGPQDAALENPGQPARLLGYGALTATKTEPFPMPPALQQGALSLIGKQDCLKAYPNAVGDKELCAQDLDTNGPLTQPCAGDSGGPLLADTPNGPVQIGVTSWGAEVKEKACGEARLPAVWMRVSAFHDFITAPDPVLAPTTSLRKAAVRGYGKRLTCVPPAFKGSAAKLSYRWGIARFKGQLIPEQPHPLTIVASGRRFTRGGKATRGKQIACEVQAANAGGHWLLYSPSVNG